MDYGPEVNQWVRERLFGHSLPVVAMESILHIYRRASFTHRAAPTSRGSAMFLRRTDLAPKNGETDPIRALISLSVGGCWVAGPGILKPFLSPRANLFRGPAQDTESICGRAFGARAKRSGLTLALRTSLKTEPERSCFRHQRVAAALRHCLIARGYLGKARTLEDFVVQVSQPFSSHDSMSHRSVSPTYRVGCS